MPIIERPVEYEAVRRALTQPDGRGRGIVLTGPAGVGKTTLARAVTGELDNVRWVVGSESARAIPLGAFATVVSPSTARDAVGYLSAARESLLRSGDLILGVDDAHLLDPLSATLLHQLALDGDARIIATCRSGETVPDAVVSLWKDRYLELLELGAFTRAESVAMLEQSLGGPVEGLSADLMWKASGGNALFLHHLIDGAREAGSLRFVKGIWQLRGNATVTTEFAALLEGRIAALPDSVVHVLSLMSVCEPIEVDVLTRIAGDDEVEDAERRGLIRIGQDGRHLLARFAHPLLGEVVRSRIGRLRARRLRGQLVAVIADRGRPSTGPGRIRLAELAIDADHEVDRAIMVDAARSAIGLADISAAERFARAALERGAGIDGADLLSRALLWQGRPDEVEDTMAALDPADLDEVGVLRWGITRVANFYFAKGDGESGDEILALLRERITTPELVLVVEGVEAVRKMDTGDLPGAVETARKVFADEHAIGSATYWAAFAAQRSLALMGDGTAVLDIARRVRIPASMDGLIQFSTVFGELQAHLFMGRFTAARALADEYTQFSSPGEYLAWGMAQTFRGVVDVAEGRFGGARVRLREAVAALTSDVMSAWSFPARIALVTTYAQLGDAAAAKALANKVRGDLRPHIALFDPPLRSSEVWVAAAEGQIAEAISLAHDAASAAAALSQRMIAAEALHAAARLGDTDAAAELVDLEPCLDGELVGLYVRHARAVATGDASALEECAHDFESLGALASATDAAAQASSGYSAAGDAKSATRTAGLAHRLASECGGIATPALVAMADPLPLTAREREIANLVTAGLSNREIGERLSLSTRTVEGHVYRACMKLDVEDRAELAERIRAR